MDQSLLPAAFQLVLKVSANGNSTSPVVRGAIPDKAQNAKVRLGKMGVSR